MKIHAKIEGIADLTRNMEVFKQSVRNRVLRKSINAAETPLLKLVKAKLKDYQGGPSLHLTRKSLGKKTKTYATTVVGIIGPRLGFAQDVDGERVDPAKIANFIEYGRGEVKVKEADILYGHGQFWGKEVGPAAAKPFLRPAYDEGKAAAMATIREKIRTEIAIEAAKLAVKKK